MTKKAVPSGFNTNVRKTPTPSNQNARWAIWKDKAGHQTPKQLSEQQLKEKVVVLEVQLRDQKAASEAYKKQTEELNRRAYQQRNDAVEAQLVSERIVASKRQLTSLEKEIEEQRAAVLEAQNRRLEATGEIQQKLNERAEEVLGLEADLAQTKEENQQLKGTVAELEAEIQAMEDALEPQDRRHAPKGGNSKDTAARPDYLTLKRKAEDHLYTIGQPKTKTS
ncbi:hypothetical protein NM208_g10613 [Fusarium decemcellulare]|uniref:Uncharacterized protein n=1 Tax=Fusarium decemcellulare TaxID=57161 RepID=A0ACC1RXA1_9HYPO|nr:hypothetical protein NM208_g10613 [Fusarium decemcellulare]